MFLVLLSMSCSIIELKCISEKQWKINPLWGSQHYNWHFGSDCEHNWSYALNVPHIVKHMPGFGRCGSIVRGFMHFSILLICNL